MMTMNMEMVRGMRLTMMMPAMVPVKMTTMTGARGMVMTLTMNRR